MGKFGNEISLVMLVVACLAQTCPVNCIEGGFCPMVAFPNVGPEGRVAVCIPNAFEVLLDINSWAGLPVMPQHLPPAAALDCLKLCGCRVGVNIESSF
jgi:hypothetical protein